MEDFVVGCGLCALITGVLLTVILVPLSFSYVDYYDYGLEQRRSTGSVDTSQVFSSGRYFNGVDKKFIKYQADAHLESFEALDVFSASSANSSSVGLEFKVDVDFTFFLIEDEIGELHRELASNYRNIILSQAKEAIKNVASEEVSFAEFFQDRKQVEALFRSAVEERWSGDPPLHCKMDQFHLGRIRIPESVAEKQLEAVVQNEHNRREQSLQEAQLEREKTAVDVNQIDLQTTKALRTARAQAKLVEAKAEAEARLLTARAGINGTRMLLEAAGIETQEHKTVFAYVQTLRDRKEVDLDVSYLRADGVVRTAPASPMAPPLTARDSIVSQSNNQPPVHRSGRMPGTTDALHRGTPLVKGEPM